MQMKLCLFPKIPLLSYSLCDFIFFILQAGLIHMIKNKKIIKKKMVACQKKSKIRQFFFHLIDYIQLQFLRIGYFPKIVLESKFEFAGYVRYSSAPTADYFQFDEVKQEQIFAVLYLTNKVIFFFSRLSSFLIF